MQEEYPSEGKIAGLENSAEHAGGGAGCSGNSGNVGGSLKNRSKTKTKKHKKSQKPYRQEIIYYHAMLSMCGGFYKGLCALTKDGRIRQPMPKFDNEAIRFRRRFLPFENLTSPPAVSYEEFKYLRSHMMALPSSEIYAFAAKHFYQARNALETILNPEQEVSVSGVAYLKSLQFAKIVIILNRFWICSMWLKSTTLS